MTRRCWNLSGNCKQASNNFRIDSLQASKSPPSCFRFESHCSRQFSLLAYARNPRLGSPFIRIEHKISNFSRYGSTKLGSKLASRDFSGSREEAIIKFSIVKSTKSCCREREKEGEETECGGKIDNGIRETSCVCGPKREGRGRKQKSPSICLLLKREIKPQKPFGVGGNKLNAVFPTPHRTRKFHESSLPGGFGVVDVWRWMQLDEICFCHNHRLSSAQDSLDFRRIFIEMRWRVIKSNSLDGLAGVTGSRQTLHVWTESSLMATWFIERETLREASTIEL